MGLALADFAEQAGIVILRLLLVAGVVGLVLSLLAPLVSLQNPVTRLGHGILALLLVIAAAWVVLYAMGPDAYSSSGYSRWEHASRGGSTLPILVAIGAAAATSVGLGASAVAPGGVRLRVMTALAAALSCFLLLLAWLFLTWGH